MTKKKLIPIKGQTHLRQYHFYGVEKRNKITAHMVMVEVNRPSATVDIPYRADGRVRGTGAFFDHRSVQITANVRTNIILDGHNEAHLNEYMQNHSTVSLSHIPPILTTTTSTGLLFLPGLPRSIKKTPAELQPRQERYNTLIQDAINRGKPILAICGGSWALWEYFGGILKKVKDHAAPRMPSVNAQGKVGYNIQIHRIKLEDNALILKAAMNYSNNFHHNPAPSVNSVHWLAASDTHIPSQFDVSARSLFDANLERKTRHNLTMHPEENIIEAFESRYGAPILGIQWHPEAYTNNTEAEYYPEQQQAIIKYMAEASRTYQIKQQVNAQIKQLAHHPVFSEKKGTPTHRMGDIVTTQQLKEQLNADLKQRFSKPYLLRYNTLRTKAFLKTLRKEKSGYSPKTKG